MDSYLCNIKGLNPNQVGKVSPSLPSPIPVQDHWESSFESYHWVPIKKPAPWPKPRVATPWKHHCCLPRRHLESEQLLSLLILLDYWWYLIQATTASLSPFSLAEASLAVHFPGLYLNYVCSHSGCRGKVRFQFITSPSMGSPKDQCRGCWSLPYTQPRRGQSSDCIIFQAAAMQTTPRCTCYFSQMNSQLWTRSQILFQTTTSNPFYL